MSDLKPGTVIAMRYRIVKRLAQGGMGTVYRAHHLGLGHDVALKVLPQEEASLERSMRFEREARAVAQLDHPCCVRVLDYGQTDDRLRYLAMELLRGPSLAEELEAHGPLPVAQAVRYATDLLKALAHSHSRGVLHRDVKAANVVLAERSGIQRAVLIDFGLARSHTDTGVTAANVCVGSPSYVAPERLVGRSYDGRADLYAVGVLLYEMLSGVRPFRGNTPVEIARQHVQCVARPLGGIRPEVPPALAAVVVKAMAKDPDKRYADAEAMLSAMEDVDRAEAEAAQALRARRAEDASTMVVAQIVVPKASLGKRVWAWLRFGEWRFSH
jgi:serine/threonine-protein kinase